MTAVADADEASCWQAVFRSEDVHRRATRRAWLGMTSLSRTEEQALILRAQSGDRLAYEALVRDSADRLYGVVLRFSPSEADAEEATQEAFLRAWRNIDRFRGDARFFTWLYRIGVNEAKRILERRPTPGKIISVEEQSIADLSDVSPQLHAQAEAAELRQVLESAIKRLPEKYRAAVVLRDIEGLSTSEAAGLLGLQEAAFKSRLHRGRMALRADVAHYLAGDEAPVSTDPQPELS